MTEVRRKFFIERVSEILGFSTQVKRLGHSMYLRQIWVDFLDVKGIKTEDQCSK